MTLGNTGLNQVQQVSSKLLKEFLLCACNSSNQLLSLTHTHGISGKTGVFANSFGKISPNTVSMPSHDGSPQCP